MKYLLYLALIKDTSLMYFDLKQVFVNKLKYALNKIYYVFDLKG